MIYEHSADKAHKHDMHDHELYDHHLEHAHEGHVCSATCEHHQAVQHIDFMESVNRHDHEEHGHIHGPDCGHVEYEQAHLHVDHGKEKPHFHDPHEEHVHGPNCGHMAYQHVHTEIDKPHIHDEHCGHLDHHKAAEHVDHGKVHKDEPADHPHEENHIHGPNCGHMEYEKAHKYVDVHVDELSAGEAVSEHVAGDAESFNDNHVEGVARQVEQTTSEQRQTVVKATAESRAASGQAAPSKADAGPEVKAAAPVALKTPNTPTIDESVIVRSHEQTVVEADNAAAATELTSPVDQAIEQLSSIAQHVELVTADATAPASEFEMTDLSSELESIQEMEMPLILSGEESSPEFVHEPVTDFTPSEGSEILDSLDEFGVAPFDLAQDLSSDADMDFKTLEQIPRLQFVEGLTPEILSDISTSEDLTSQDVGSAADFAPTEQRIDFSNFANGQIPEVYNVEWPILAEINEDELEGRLDTTRTYIARVMEQANKIDPSDLDDMSYQLIAMLQNMPKESVEELLPLLEELTELFELPQLERLLELYFAGHYQDRSLFTQLFRSTTQDTLDITARIGQIVLKLLNGSKYIQNSA